MDTVYSKALWERRRSLVGWGAALASLVLLESALWPSMESMKGLDAYLAEFPDTLKDVFGMDQMTTGQGFLNAELFSLMLPLVLIAYGVSTGARLIAGEQESGRLDLLLVTPLTTARMLLDSVAALMTCMAILGGVVTVSTLAGSVLFGLGIGVGAAVAGGLSITLIGFEFGVVALVVGALTGRRALAIAAAAVLGIGSYVLYIGAAFTETLASWSALSPFDQALANGPLTTHIDTSLGWLVLVPALLVTLCVPLWGRRDL